MGQEVQRCSKRLKADRVRERRQRQDHETHDQEDGDSKQATREQGMSNQRRNTTADQKEYSGPSESHDKVEKEAKCGDGDPARVGAATQEAAGYRLQ